MISKLTPIETAKQYLVLRECKITREYPNMIEFKLNDDSSNVSHGRISVSGNGNLKMWHRFAKNGLQAGEPWKSCDSKDLKMPVLSCHVNDLKLQPALLPLTKVPLFQMSNKLFQFEPEQLLEAATRNLTSNGFLKISKDRFTDGTDKSPVVQLHVGSGVATVFSYRNDIDLPEPWKVGKPDAEGRKIMFASGRALGLGGGVEVETFSKPASITSAREVRAVDHDLGRNTFTAWKQGLIPPADHPQLNKKNAVLDGSDLRIYPFKNNHINQLVMPETIMVPIFRPGPENSPGTVQLCGLQYLFPEKNEFSGTDKMIAKNSVQTGAFLPLPCPDSLMKKLGADALAPIDAWLAHADLTKPLVICEGVSSGMAIQQPQAGNTLCALNKDNVVVVAKWVKDSGLAEKFPKVIIATEYDITRDDKGRFKSNAIEKAVGAAKENGFLVAVPPVNSPSGTDARDILGSPGGLEALYAYINSATTAQEIEKTRPDIFLAAMNGLEKARTEPENENDLGR